MRQPEKMEAMSTLPVQSINGNCAFAFADLLILVHCRNIYCATDPYKTYKQGYCANGKYQRSEPLQGCLV